MSFSGMVKEELSRHIGTGRHCKIAELAAIFTFCGSLGTGSDGKFFLRIQTENEALARKSFTLLQKTFNIFPDRLFQKGESFLYFRYRSGSDQGNTGLSETGNFGNQRRNAIRI